MTLAEYQSLSARTAAMEVPHNIRQATFALGLVCEATEVMELFLDFQNGAPDPELLIKELGDVLWYTSGLCTEHEMDLTQICGLTIEQAEMRAAFQGLSQDTRRLVRLLVVRAGKVADFMKKVVGHGHDLDKKRVAEGLQDVFLSLCAICVDQGISLGNVAAANVAKLKVRYPEGFSSEASINRSA
jgi:NTP pyrophosphatase (non-canonical NTP hydrolase)